MIGSNATRGLFEPWEIESNRMSRRSAEGGGRLCGEGG